MKKAELPTEIRTDRLVLKSSSIDMLEQHRDLRNKNSRSWGLYEDAKYYKEEYSIEEIRKASKEHNSQDLVFAIFFENKMIGGISIDDISYSKDSCKLGFAIDEDFHGKGFMTETLRSIEKFLKSQGFNRVVLHINVLNKKSLALAERNDYFKEGIARSSSKHLIDIENGRKYSDIAIYSKLLQEDR
jgi:RimJ/RimL family protein N-acetyltransferase